MLACRLDGVGLDRALDASAPLAATQPAAPTWTRCVIIGTHRCRPHTLGGSLVSGSLALPVTEERGTRRRGSLKHVAFDSCTAALGTSVVQYNTCSGEVGARSHCMQINNVDQFIVFEATSTDAVLNAHGGPCKMHVYTKTNYELVTCTMGRLRRVPWNTCSFPLSLRKGRLSWVGHSGNSVSHQPIG